LTASPAASRIDRQLEDSLYWLWQVSFCILEWRDYVHGECAQAPSSNSGMQYLTDGKRKYIWLPGQHRELFFDLENDPREMRHLADDAG